ncbi:hypothetical protein Tco_1525299 [Tanacetum coccineum]
MVINSPCLIDKKELAIPGKMATGKEFSNPLMAGSLPKTISAKDSDNIIRTQTTAMPNVNIPLGMDTGSSPRRQETMRGAPAQTRSERVLKQPNEPPLSEGHTSRRGYTPGSDEGRLKLKELMAMCTKLSKQVLDLEKEKDAQAVEILKLKQRVKKLERRRKSSISYLRRRICNDFDDLNDLVDEGMAFVQEKDVENQGVSTAAPRTPPTTTKVFDDEDVTMAMAQTLIKMKE